MSGPFPSVEAVPRPSTIPASLDRRGAREPPTADPYPRTVIPGLVTLHVDFDPNDGVLHYRVEEPALTEAERRASRELDRVLPGIVPPRALPLGRSTNGNVLSETVDEYLRLHHPGLTEASRAKILYYRHRDAFGLGPVDAILHDPEVEDVSCDGPGVPVFVHHARFEAIRTNVRFSSEEELRGFVVHLAQRCERSISVARPLLDGVTSAGHRVQATYGREVTSRGSGFAIRRFRDRPFTPIDLLRSGAASPELIAHLWLAVELGDSMIVCGGPGVGKTSTLNALAQFIPRSAKIVSIEDTRELCLVHEHWVPSTTRVGSSPRSAGERSAGEIDMYDLLTVALRQRPSHILVGEVRGAEAVTMFQAMATGHATYATMHADSVRGMVARLESPPIRVPRALFGSLRQVLIEVQRKTPTGVIRRLSQLVEIGGIDPETDEIVASPSFEWDPRTDSFQYQGHSLLLDRAAALRGSSVAAVEQDLERRAEWLRRVAHDGVSDAANLRERLDAFRSRSPADRGTARPASEELP